MFHSTERFNQTQSFLSVIDFGSVRWNERGWPVRYQGQTADLNETFSSFSGAPMARKVMMSRGLGKSRRPPGAA